MTEAGNRQGCPGGGGTAGVTGTEEKTVFSLSTDIESDLSPIWRKKILKPLKYPVGISVEGRYRGLEASSWTKTNSAVRSSKVEVEEEQHDDEEVRRIQRMHLQPSREKPPEETRNV